MFGEDRYTNTVDGAAGFAAYHACPDGDAPSRRELDAEAREEQISTWLRGHLETLDKDLLVSIIFEEVGTLTLFRLFEEEIDYHFGPEER